MKSTLGALALACAACSPTRAGFDAAEFPASAQGASEAQGGRSPSGMTMRNLAERYPDATLLGADEFTNEIQGRAFSYREVGSELVVERPKEVFGEGGQYRIHWIRTISYGTYSVERGIVSIDCTDCQRAFLGLGTERIFFRHQGRLFTANADGDRSVVELIREP